MSLTDFYRVETVGVHPAFIDGLGDMVMARLNDTGIKSNQMKSLCPRFYKLLYDTVQKASCLEEVICRTLF